MSETCSEMVLMLSLWTKSCGVAIQKRNLFCNDVTRYYLFVGFFICLPLGVKGFNTISQTEKKEHNKTVCFRHVNYVASFTLR